MKGRVIFTLLALLAFAPLRAEIENFTALTISVDRPSEDLTHARASVQQAMREIKVQDRQKPRSQVLKNGHYLLYGDLFGNGKVYALIELGEESEDDRRVAFAQWINGKWQLCGLWKIDSVWRPKDRVKGNNDYLPITPAQRPFELMDCNGDGIPEVIIVGEVWKYFQQHYLLRFDPETDRLQFIVEAMAKPQLVDGYVRLYYNSGRRALFEKWCYLKWSNGKFVPVASWKEGGDGDTGYIEAQALNRKGALDTFLIKPKEECVRSERLQMVYPITRNGKKYATLGFSYKIPCRIDLSVERVAIKLWLFERLTKLPRTLLPSESASYENKPLPSINEVGTLSFRGMREARDNLFSKQQGTRKGDGHEWQ